MPLTANTPVLVIDSSVVVKWYLVDEDSAEDALALRSAFIEGRFRIAMPTIARYEIANALIVAHRRQRISQDQALQAVADVLTWDFAYVGTDELIIAAVDVAQRFDCALYDAAYLALAEQMGCGFVTADRALFQKAHAQASWATWLSTYSY